MHSRLLCMTRSGALIGLLLTAGVFLAASRSRWSAEELFEYVSTSAALGYGDEVTARGLGGIELTQRLSDEAIDELRRMGAGPLTMRAMVGICQRSSFLDLPANPVVTLKSPPTGNELAILNARLAAYARGYIHHLPEFSCRQTTRFFTDRSALLPRRDDLGVPEQPPVGPMWFGEGLRLEKTIVEQLDYYGGGEHYETKLVDNKPDRRPVTSGTESFVSRGELGTIPYLTFAEPSGVRIAWDHWETIEGRRLAVLSYAVDRKRSLLRVCCSTGIRASFYPSYLGLVYVDAETGAINRLSLRYVDLQPNAPFDDARVLLDYRLFKIGATTHLLLARAVMTIRSGLFAERSEMTFADYRKFQAESVIKFAPENGDVGAAPIAVSSPGGEAAPIASPR